MIINYVLLFVSTLDTIFIILGHSLKKIKFSFLNIFTISLVSSVMLLLSLLLSTYVSGFVSKKICDVISSILLLVIGFFNIFVYLLKCYLKKRKNSKSIIEFKASDVHFMINIFLENDDADINNDLVLSFKEALLLSIVLSIDGISTGVIIGLMGINVFIAFFISFIAQIIFSYLGIALSKVVNKERDCTLINGIILIVLAILKNI